MTKTWNSLLELGTCVGIAGRRLAAGSVAARAEPMGQVRVALLCFWQGLLQSLGCSAAPGTLSYGLAPCKGRKGQGSAAAWPFLLLLCLQCQRAVSTYFSKGDFHQGEKKIWQVYRYVNTLFYKQ